MKLDGCNMETNLFPSEKTVDLNTEYQKHVDLLNHKYNNEVFELIRDTKKIMEEDEATVVLVHDSVAEIVSSKHCRLRKKFQDLFGDDSSQEENFGTSNKMSVEEDEMFKFKKIMLTKNYDLEDGVKQEILDAETSSIGQPENTCDLFVKSEMSLHHSAVNSCASSPWDYEDEGDFVIVDGMYIKKDPSINLSASEESDEYDSNCEFVVKPEFVLNNRTDVGGAVGGENEFEDLVDDFEFSADKPVNQCRTVYHCPVNTDFKVSINDRKASNQIVIVEEADLYVASDEYEVTNGVNDSAAGKDPSESTELCVRPSVDKCLQTRFQAADKPVSVDQSTQTDFDQFSSLSVLKLFDELIDSYNILKILDGNVASRQAALHQSLQYILKGSAAHELEVQQPQPCPRAKLKKCEHCGKLLNSDKQYSEHCARHDRKLFKQFMATLPKAAPTHKPATPPAPKHAPATQPAAAHKLTTPPASKLSILPTSASGNIVEESTPISTPELTLEPTPELTPEPTPESSPEPNISSKSDIPLKPSVPPKLDVPPNPDIPPKLSVSLKPDVPPELNIPPKFDVSLKQDVPPKLKPDVTPTKPDAKNVVKPANERGPATPSKVRATGKVGAGPSVKKPSPKEIYCKHCGEVNYTWQSHKAHLSTHFESPKLPSKPQTLLPHKPQPCPRAKLKKCEHCGKLLNSDKQYSEHCARHDRKLFKQFMATLPKAAPTHKPATPPAPKHAPATQPAAAHKLTTQPASKLSILPTTASATLPASKSNPVHVPKSVPAPKVCKKRSIKEEATDGDASKRFKSDAADKTKSGTRRRSLPKYRNRHWLRPNAPDKRGRAPDSDQRSGACSRNRSRSGSGDRSRTWTRARSRSSSSDHYRTRVRNRSRSGSGDRSRTWIRARSRSSSSDRYRTRVRNRSRSGSGDRSRTWIRARSRSSSSDRYRTRFRNRSRSKSGERCKTWVRVKVRSRSRSGSRDRPRTGSRSQRDDKLNSRERSHKSPELRVGLGRPHRPNPGGRSFSRWSTLDTDAVRHSSCSTNRADDTHSHRVGAQLPVPEPAVPFNVNTYLNQEDYAKELLNTFNRLAQYKLRGGAARCADKKLNFNISVTINEPDTGAGPAAVGTSEAGAAEAAKVCTHHRCDCCDVTLVSARSQASHKRAHGPH